VYEEMASSGEDIKDKEVRINGLKLEFLSELSSGAHETSECMQQLQQLSSE